MLGVVRLADVGAEACQSVCDGRCFGHVWVPVLLAAVCACGAYVVSFFICLWRLCALLLCVGFLCLGVPWRLLLLLALPGGCSRFGIVRSLCCLVRPAHGVTCNTL